MTTISSNEIESIRQKLAAISGTAQFLRLEDGVPAYRIGWTTSAQQDEMEDLMTFHKAIQDLSGLIGKEKELMEI